jgi:hypothetical protein
MEGFQQARFEDTLPIAQATYQQSNILTDPAAHLPGPAGARLVALQQRAHDLHVQIPNFDQINDVRLQVRRHEQRIHQLMKPRSDRGFNLGADAPQVVGEQQLLERAKTELKRLEDLREIRTAHWNAVGGLARAVLDWLRSGVPGNCELVAVDDVPIVGLLKKNESIADAVSRHRHRLREAAADLHRVRSSPYTSAEAKALAADQINKLADAAEPDVSCCVELLAPIQFMTTRTRTLASSADPKLAPSIVHTETHDALGLVAWLFRDQLVAKIEVSIDEIADDPAALSAKERQVREAQILADMLEIERSECSLIRAAEARGETIDFRVGTSPLALLGVALVVTGSRATASQTSLGMAIDYIGSSER